MIHSGTDGRNSDIGALSDFSDDMEETGVEQLSGCRIPGCKCDRRVVVMKWGSDGLPEMDDSEYESNTSDRVFQTDQESSKLEPRAQPRMVVKDDIPKLKDTLVDHQQGRRTGSDRDYSSEEESNLCDRPVTKTATAGDGQDSLDPNDTEYWANVSRLVRQAFLLNDDSLSDDNYPDVVKNLVRNSWRTRRAMDEHDALPLEQQTGCGTPGCQCDGRVNFMVQGSEYRTETDR